MYFTTRQRHAINLLAQLAGSPATPITLASVASDLHCALSYLEQIVVDLRAARLVIGQRGPGGGYVLNGPAELITVAEIIAALSPLRPGKDDAARQVELRLLAAMTDLTLADLAAPDLARAA